MRSIRTLSLFTGAGGLDVGFHEAGFDIVGCLEIDTPSCETLKLNVGKYVSSSTQVFNADITLTEPESLDVGKIDFIIGGPPCQSFSAAGRRAGGVHGINDTRGSLFWFYCKYLEYFRPTGFLFENVKGILQANNSADWDIILKSFESVGYSINFKVLDAADFGTPQHRERLIMVGVRNDLTHTFLFPSPTHGPAGVKSKEYMTPWMALKDLYDDDEVVRPYGGKYGHLLKDIPPGMNYLHYTEKMAHPSPLFAWRSKFSGFLYKLPKDEPSKTVVAHQGRYDGPFHWNNRKLTIPELKRIQGFPDDYLFVSSKVEAVRQIGNSVAPRMGRKLADAVKLQFFGANDVDISLSQQSDTSHHSKRKAVKAAKTKKKTNGTSLNSLNQLDLFSEAREYKVNQSFRNEVSSLSGAYGLDGILESGTWRISVHPKVATTSMQVTATLNFYNPAGCDFNTIIADASLCHLNEISVFWDAIHHAIESSSSYEGLMPLYGHFTEPHPKFQLDMRFLHFEAQTAIEEKICKLILRLSDFSFLSSLHRSVDFFHSDDEANEAFQIIRSIGFDVRTHETNRAIKEGYFKPCYPFSLYTKTNTYTVWRDKGTHRTGDVRVNVADGKVTIS